MCLINPPPLHSQLGKAGAVSYMFRVIQMCGKKHVTHLKLALDILSLLCKSKSNAARLISLGKWSYGYWLN